MERKYFKSSNTDLAALILAGDSEARSEGILRTDARIARGRKPHGSVFSALSKTSAPVPAPSAPAPAPSAPSTPDTIAAIVARAVAEALAARGLTPAPAPAPDVHTDDVLWAECLEECGGSRWAAYDRMETIIGKRKRTRIAAAAGVSVGAVSNAISKHRRGIAPDLSFVGK